MARKTNKKVKVIKDDVQGAGAVVFWSLSGATPYEEFIDALEDNDIPEKYHPEPPTPAEALRSTEKDSRRFLPKGYFTRKLDKHTYAVVQETRDSDDAKTSKETYQPIVKVGCAVTPVEDDDGKVIDHRVRFWHKFRRGTQQGIKELLTAYVQEFLARFKQARTEIALHHLDWWVRRVMGEYVHTVTLGERGKPYYVSPTCMAKYTALTTAVMTASDDSHTFNQIPAMRSDDCIESVMAACLREVTKKCEGVYAALEDDDKKLGARALRTKQKELETLLTKMTSFEALIGPGLDRLREDIEECQATVIEAELVIEAEKEAEKDA